MFKGIKKSLRKIYGKKICSSQQSRVTSLCKLVYAIISSRHCSLKHLGEYLPDFTDLESRIKKSKRFLQSKYTDFDTFYLPVLNHLLSRLSVHEMILMIDGSEVGNGCTALMVSLKWRNRALPLCWIVRKCKKGHLPVSAHLEVLGCLASLIPQGKVALLGDGEFDSPELQAFCESQGWQYVLRTAKNTIVSPDPNPDGGFAVESLYPMEGHDYWFSEALYFTKRLYGPVAVMVWHSPKHCDPLYLVSNMEWPKDLMDYYSKRFLIETMFRDIKSSGFNIHKVRVKDPAMMNNLLMIVCIAYLLTVGFGAFELKNRIVWSKIARKDRAEELSVFHIGFIAIAFYKEKGLCIPPKFSKNFFKYFCVRF